MVFDLCPHETPPGIVCSECEQEQQYAVDSLVMSEFPQPQKIGTAPKDGSNILAWFPDHGWMSASYCDYDDANNACGWAIGFDNYGPPPSHWMPLPEPPNAMEGEKT